jgi:hypothetical protein
VVRRRGAAPWLALASVLVLLAGSAVVALSRADTASEYDEDAAVSAFRSAGPAGGVTPAPEPTGPSGPRPSSAGALSASAGPAGPAPAAPAPAGSAPAGPGSTSGDGGTAAPRPGGTAAAAPPARGATPGDGEVPVGVYRYATEGFEEVDALGGARHDYPATTTVTYARADCGTEERWQPLRERVGAATSCAGTDGDELRATYQRREFFGQSQEKSYRCDPGLLLRPAEPRPGRTWRGTCRSADSTAAFSGRVVALEDLVVDGTRVPVVRVRLDGTLTGSTRGRSDREVWLRRADGLLVQAVGRTDTDADTPGGTVRYRESYRLRLLSLQPRR